jgi:hypothetical protein
MVRSKAITMVRALVRVRCRFRIWVRVRVRFRECLVYFLG